MSGDLFGDRQIERIRLRTPPHRQWAQRAPASRASLALVGALAAPPAWLLGMSPATCALFVAACVATRAARNRRALQQTLRVAAIALFLSFAEVTFMVAFPPVVRLVFFAALAGGAVALYEWAMPK